MARIGPCCTAPEHCGTVINHINSSVSFVPSRPLHRLWCQSFISNFDYCDLNRSSNCYDQSSNMKPKLRRDSHKCRFAEVVGLSSNGIDHERDCDDVPISELVAINRAVKEYKDLICCNKKLDVGLLEKHHKDALLRCGANKVHCDSTSKIIEEEVAAQKSYLEVLLSRIKHKLQVTVGEFHDAVLKQSRAMIDNDKILELSLEVEVRKLDAQIGALEEECRISEANLKETLLSTDTEHELKKALEEQELLLKDVDQTKLEWENSQRSLKTIQDTMQLDAVDEIIFKPCGQKYDGPPGSLPQQIYISKCALCGENFTLCDIIVASCSCTYHAWCVGFQNRIAGACAKRSCLKPFSSAWLKSIGLPRSRSDTSSSTPESNLVLEQETPITPCGQGGQSPSTRVLKRMKL